MHHSGFPTQPLSVIQAFADYLLQVISRGTTYRTAKFVRSDDFGISHCLARGLWRPSLRHARNFYYNLSRDGINNTVRKAFLLGIDTKTVAEYQTSQGN